MIKFSQPNKKTIKTEKKLGGKLYSFDLLAGHSCPFAKECQSRVIIKDNKSRIQDGPHTKFRCFSASQEVLYPNVYKLRKQNYEGLVGQSFSRIVLMLETVFPPDATIIRIHVSGDFFSQNYFNAWMELAKRKPNVLFYTYTKAIPYWLHYVQQHGSLPTNVVMTASYGGTHDHLITKYNLRSAIVVMHATDTTLQIDNDDSIAANPYRTKENFALLLHSTQPIGSIASKVVTARNRKIANERRRIREAG